MKHRNRQLLLAVVCAVLAALFFPSPEAAIAGSEDRTTSVTTREKGRTTTVVTHENDWDTWSDPGQDLLRMQRETLSSQEEQAREAGRVRRRDEVEKVRQKSSAEHEAYYDAILEDSQAALRAPLGVYYRKPGYVRTDAPASDGSAVEVGGISYQYDQGIFWLQQGARSIVVTAPVGAVVNTLPQGVTRVPAKTGPVWYFFGTFFAEKGGGYQVIKPPVGITVFYLPDGYSQERVNGVGLYRFGDILFKPVFVQGVLAYQAVEP